jgi:predicted phage terminase large subunit-like protein
MAFDLLSPNKPLMMNWHIERLAYHLEQVRLGRKRRLIINLPPRYLKSLITSVAFPAFVLGHDPAKRLIVVSYGSELAVKLANDFRGIINSRRYRAIFPNLQISPLKNTETEVVTARGGFRLATSVDGALTGRGGDIIIIDDPIKPSDARSESRREHVNNWYKETLLSRLDDKQKGAIIIVMQRLHCDDLCGFVLKNSLDWTVLDFPAIAVADERIQIGEGRYYDRRVGDVLHPERESRSDLDRIRSEVGEDIFAAQYLQRPMPPSGALIKRDSIRRYDQLPARSRASYLIQAWDTAGKAGPDHDYSACATMLLHDSNYYLVDMIRGHFIFPELIAHAISHGRNYKPAKILIEDAALGRALAGELQAAGLPAALIKPEGNKETRMSLQSVKFANGQVFFPNHAPWLAELESELFAFPNGRYDDQIDSIAYALGYSRPSYPDALLEGMNRFSNALWWNQVLARLV